VCCARTKVSNERGWTTLNANGWPNLSCVSSSK
jgi:hypothetical protein